MVTTKDQVLEQVKYYCDEWLTDKQIEIQDDLSVIIHTSVDLVKPPPQGRLPIKLHMVDGDVGAYNMKLTTLENFPDVCENLDVSNNLLDSLAHVPASLVKLNVRRNRLTSLEHLDETSAVYVNAIQNPLTSLKGLDSVRPELELWISWDPQLPMLRLLNATHVFISDKGDKVEPLNTIMNTYAGKGKTHMLNCALELKKAGYEGNARW